MWWQRRTAIFLSARLIEVARLASTSVNVNICKIQKATNFTYFYLKISKIFHIRPSKIVYIVYTIILLISHFAPFFFSPFSSSSFSSDTHKHKHKHTHTHTQTHRQINTEMHKHTHANKPTERQIGAGSEDRCLWVDGVRACGFWFLWCWWVFHLVVLVVEIGACGG